jgi:hypothetical protein
MRMNRDLLTIRTEYLEIEYDRLFRQDPACVG